MYPIVTLGALVVFGIGLYVLLLDTKQYTLLAAGCVSLVLIGATWPIAHAITQLAQEASGSQQLMQNMSHRLDQLNTLMVQAGEAQLLSDRAKSVAFREKDRDAIRRAMEEEMSKGEWEAAYALADQFEQAFGSKTEADRFRGEINAKRQEDSMKQINEVAVIIDRFTRTEQWTAAVREAEKLRERFPANEQVRHLPADIEARRQNHKRQLLQSWNEAVARHDVDSSIEILKQLDNYLTPAEADSMQDTARGVFKEKLNNLGAQFAQLIREHKWAEAVRIGEQIQGEFPNSRAAQEVRDKMDMLRQRAGETAQANV
jgi:hypothetical protein